MMLSPEPFRVNFSGQQHLAKNIGWLTSGTCEGVAPIGESGILGKQKKNGESVIESVTETRPLSVSRSSGGATPVPEGMTLVVGQQEDRSRVGGLFC